MSDNIPFEGLLITASASRSADAKTSNVSNPANGDVIAHVAQATKKTPIAPCGSRTSSSPKVRGAR